MVFLKKPVCRALLMLGLAMPAMLQGQAARHVSCTAIDATQKAANPAQELLWNGDARAAGEKFKELLAQRPNDAEMTENSVRALIQAGDLATAAAQAQSALAAHPDSAAANTAQGEVLFREGKISEADKLYARATQLDPCYAAARLGIYRVASASSMYASARSAIGTAHALNQRDPEIHAYWVSTLPLKDRIVELKKLDAALDHASPQGRDSAANLTAEQEHLETMGQHSCELVSSVESAKVPMVAILRDMTHVEKWGVDTIIQGKTARLAVDSGASGLVVGHAFAAKAGLKLVESERLGGFGDHGPQKAHIAFADSIRIGSLEFRDCEVDVSDRREILELDGLIGTDVFRHYLVSVNFPDHSIALGPLPARPGAKAVTDENSSLSTEEDADVSSSGAQDAYIAPEMQAFKRFYRFGHLLLVPTSVNKGVPGLMVLDTGDVAVSLSPTAAGKATHVHSDNTDELRGLSGKVERLSYGGDVTFQFGPARVVVGEVLVTDHSKMSSQIGTEVSGFLGFPALESMVMQLDYRDGLVNFLYDPKKDANRSKAPGTECSYCDPGYSK